jgi:magnesium transporter
VWSTDETFKDSYMIPRRTSKKIGLSPGSLVYVGDKPKDEPVHITVIDYGPAHYSEKSITTLDECGPYLTSDSITWINVSGIHDVGTIEQLGGAFNIHPLVLEDVVNTEQRPKMEDYDNYLFIVMKMLYAAGAQHTIKHEQISLIVGKGYVISLQEVALDVFDPVRERIKKGRGRIRKKGGDYLAYALMDMVVDHYFKILEDLGETIEELHDTLIHEPEPDTLLVIQSLKREMLYVRKSLWPLREVINTLLRDDSVLISDEVVLYLRDVYDHIIHVIDTVETFRDMLSGMLDIYLSSLSNKMNEVMKVLTIIATIFIPLTFIAGIYGMNFEFMPELKWKFAYPVLWLIMLAIFIGMLIYFKRRKWL